MTPRIKTEAEATVPQDPLEELRADVKMILAHVAGSYDEHGEHHPGLSHRVKRLENIVNWGMGIASTLLAGLGLSKLTGHGP